MRNRYFSLLSAAIVVLGLFAAGAVNAQESRNEQFYYPGSFNWVMLKNYPEAARLFNAFDYGHAILYEKLYTEPDAPVATLESKQFDYITGDLLIRPPRFAVAEEVIEPSYARLAWKAKLMFDWAHVLHRQIYDLYADDRLSEGAKDSLIEVVTDYYLSNKDLAFASAPKSMQLMDGQYFSQEFRRRYPKMNGLIWAYHWLQVGLYEPLIAGKTPAEKKAGVKAVLARFWSMIEDPPNRFPKVMPMTAAVAPEFARRHPRAAVAFDNLHMMHDIISDVLTSSKVPRGEKRAEIYHQLADFTRPDQNTMALDEWCNMGELMGGVGLMGGPALGILPDPPTVGASAPEMAGMDHGGKGHEMGQMGQAMDSMPGMKPASDSAPDHHMTGMDMSAIGGDSTMERHMQPMMELHRRMMADSVIHQRMMADTAMRRMMQGMMDRMAPEHRQQMESMMMGGMGVGDSIPTSHQHHAPAAPAKPKPRKPAATRPPPTLADSTSKAL
ncbi:MAG: hypothetical protein ACREMO_13825 [Gemmatimonadales bacterium]